MSQGKFVRRGVPGPRQMIRLDRRPMSVGDRQRQLARWHTASHRLPLKRTHNFRCFIRFPRRI